MRFSILVLATLFTGSGTLAYPTPETPTEASYSCTQYPSEFRLMNSRFPSREFNPSTWFMALRQQDDTFIVATQVQFQGVDANPVSSCTLELVLPAPNATLILGPNPQLKVYQAARDPITPVTWLDYEGINGGTVLGKVDDLRIGGVEQGKVIVVGNAKCNETMTFHVGMAFPGQEWTNYWDFVQVNPPAVPVRGWRLTHGC
ncbi:hypothetical protein K469DRAFT_569878 [Zopfia rhizophila CBS 207.26]|uniref:Ubiquitin 3 binding protein But2 C-terminal domain-containing protein n=1 Tax=Zopfia rhizophila CBS 207.26 TaxID=1314779 RepID=A0A6A6E6F7_9PEZI|nr:hypothetical protein K469DRAFT_569878 [Zopfia rhizophila CBS 207.26]